jgi:hypothetical protein
MRSRRCLMVLWMGAPLYYRNQRGKITGLVKEASGFPLALTRNNPFPIFKGPTRPLISSYTGWRTPLAGGKFDPNADRFFDEAAFPAQPGDAFGNVTRCNPKMRSAPLFNEDVNLAKSLAFTEGKRLDFAAEAFNFFSRTWFGNANGNLNARTFGVVSSRASAPRADAGCDETVLVRQ